MVLCMDDGSVTGVKRAMIEAFEGWVEVWGESRELKHKLRRGRREVEDSFLHTLGLEGGVS